MNLGSWFYFIIYSSNIFSMTWFWISLVPPFLWAVANHMDKYLAERFYKRARVLPGTLTFLSAIVSAGLAAILFLAIPSVRTTPLWAILTLMAAGASAFVAVFPYIFALMRDEASRVVPLFQIGPVISFILGWIFLGEHITSLQIAAGGIVIFGAVTLNLDIDNRFRLKTSVLLLMVTSATLFYVEAFLFKLASIHVGFWAGATYQYVGVALSGLVLALASPAYRRSFVAVVQANRRYLFFYALADQSITTVARVLFNFATLLAPLVLVSLVTSFQPFFAILIGTLLTMFLPHISTEAITRRHLGHKIFSTAVIFFGTYLLLRS